MNFATITLPDTDDQTCEICTNAAAFTMIPLNDDLTISDDLNDHIHLCFAHTLTNTAALLDNIDD